MKFIKQSLAIVLTITSLFADKKITPISDPVVNKVDYDSHTSIQNKVQTYYYTFKKDTNLFSSEGSQLGTAVTLDVSHTNFNQDSLYTLAYISLIPILMIV